LPFFYSFSYHEKYGQLPFGDWAHGGEGLLQMYKEFFQLNDNHTVITFLKILAENKYRGSIPCPCHSGKKLHQCHRPLLKQIQHLQGSKQYAAEYAQIISYFRENNIPLDKSLVSKKAFKKARKLMRGNNNY